MSSSRHGPAVRWLQSLHDFLRLEAASGIALMIGACVAMLVSTTPLAPAY